MATYFKIKKGKKMKDILISLAILTGAGIFLFLFGYLVFSFVVA